MLIFGVLVSVLWLCGLGGVIYLNLDKAVALELNALGDFLAGGFAPLAFLWLVIGYFQQGKELKLSREALVLQASELKNSVEQQKELVAATREEIEHIKFESEKSQKEAKRIAQPFVKLTSSDLVIDSLVLTMKNYGCDVMDVSVEVCSLGDKVFIDHERSYDSWGNWGCEKEITVILKFSEVGEIGVGLLESFNIVLKYVDGLGEDSQKRFRLKCDVSKIENLVEI